MLLSWNDFASKAPNTIKQLWADQDFTDVTLATEDNQQIKVHKVILSFCSPFFRNILIKNTHQNPLIYLKGVKYNELQMLLRFIYLGECHVAHEELQDFLTTGVDLQVSGFMESLDRENIKHQEDIKENKNCISQDTLEQTSDTSSISDNLDEPNKVCPRNIRNQQQENKNNVTGKFDCRTCEKSFNTADGRLLHDKAVHKDIRYECDLCDYKATQQFYLKQHQQSKHEDVLFNCDRCEYTATRQDSLRKHQQSQHEGVRFSCDQCNFKATQQSHLKYHRQSKHEGVKYSCDQCEFKAAGQGSLRKHQQSKHEGVVYSCNQCDFNATQQSNLKTHQQSIHEGVTYNCNQCAYKATRQSHLSRHRQSKHKYFKTEPSQEK